MVRNAMSATEFYILQYLWTRETPATFSEIMVHFNEEEKKVIETIGNKYGIDFDTSGDTYNAVGCKHCNNTGYYERIGLFEVLNLTDEIKEEIMNGKSSIEVRKKALEGDYRPLIIDGINKVIQGYTTLSELNKKLLIY